MKVSKLSGVWGVLLCAAATVLLLAGCSSNSPDAGAAKPNPGAGAGAAGNVSDPNSGISSATEVLRVGDFVTVQYGDLPMLQVPFEGQIKADGTITLIHNQEFKAEGKTRTQLESEIRARYVPAYYKNMTVSVKVREDTRFYFVGGEVRAPGQRVYLSRITVLKAIQSAGDFTDFANRRKVKLTRANTNRPIVVDVLKVLAGDVPDVEVFPGDSIHVPKKFF